MKKPPIFFSLLFSALLSLPANASVSCYLVAENPQVPRQFDQMLWSQKLSPAGSEKHFILLAAEGGAAREIPEDQLKEAADVSALLSSTVVEFRRDETGYFSLWVSKVTAETEDGYHLQMTVVSLGSLVDGGWPYVSLVSRPNGNAKGAVAMQCGFDKQEAEK